MRNRAGTILLLCITAGVACAETATDTISRLLIPPGKFANLETHRVYYRCVGSGAPTVVIDNGIGGAAIEWTPVQDSVAPTTRVCTYDRAGYGWSDTGPGPRTTHHAVAELRRTLAIAGEKPPFIFVGHSFGGFNGRYYAARHRAEIAALILVESSHPEMLIDFGSGIHGPRHAINTAKFDDQSTRAGAYATTASYLNSRRKAIFVQMDEIAHFAQSAAQVTEAGDLGDLPLVVIARRDVDVATPWHDRQVSLVALSSRGRFVVAKVSDHNLHLADAEFIATEIRKVVAQVRTQR